MGTAAPAGSGDVACRNGSLRPSCRAALESLMSKSKNSLVTVGRTPVVRVNRLAPDGVNLFVKIEAFNPLGSVKDRLALGVIEAAEQAGQLKPGQTVIEATS